MVDKFVCYVILLLLWLTVPGCFGWHSMFTKAPALSGVCAPLKKQTYRISLLFPGKIILRLWGRYETRIMFF